MVLTIISGHICDTKPIGNDFSPSIHWEMFRKHRTSAEHPITRPRNHRISKQFRYLLAILEQPLQPKQMSVHTASLSSLLCQLHMFLCRLVEQRLPHFLRGTRIIHTRDPRVRLGRTTRIASVRPLRNLRVVAASYVPPFRFSFPMSLRYASCTIICAHESGDTPNFLIAALP